MKFSSLPRGLAVLAVFACLPVAAKDLHTIAGDYKLPFDYRLESRSYSQDQARFGQTTTENVRLTPLSGPLKDQEVHVLSRYVAPRSVDAGTLQNFIREFSEKVAKQPGTRSVAPVMVEGFGFYFMDEMGGDSEEEIKQAAEAKAAVAAGSAAPEPDEPPRRVLRLYGVVNFASLDMTITTPGNNSDTAALADALKQVKLDYKSLMGLASSWDGERSSRVKDGRMHSFIGSVGVPGGATPNLIFSSISRNAEGRVLARSQVFNLYKPGFWTVGGVNVLVSCEIDGGSDKDKRARITGWPAKVKKALAPTAERDLTLGGVAGKARDSRSTEDVDMTHWYGFAGDAGYEIQVSRSNGKSLGEEMLRQFGSLPLHCDDATSYGSDVPVPVAPAAAKP